jgi:hypothetical protein
VIRVEVQRLQPDGLVRGRAQNGVSVFGTSTSDEIHLGGLYDAVVQEADYGSLALRVSFDPEAIAAALRFSPADLSEVFDPCFDFEGEESERLAQESSAQVDETRGVLAQRTLEH